VAHQDGCDVARCLRSGGQRVLCPAQGTDFHDCGREVWTGWWPGEWECREWGWFSRWVPPEEYQVHGRWERCGADHPGASEDLNRLHTHAHWDPVAGRWQLGSCAHDLIDHVVVVPDDEHGQRPDLFRECRKCGFLISGSMSALVGRPMTIRHGTDAGEQAT
jgi:hypothetical protein